MAASDYEFVTLPNGKTMTLSVGVADAAHLIVLQDGAKLDLTDYTVTVNAKLDTTAKTLTVAKAANQTTTGKGKVILTIPAAQLDAEGTLYVDIKAQESGGPDVTILRRKWTVTTSLAG